MGSLRCIRLWGPAPVALPSMPAHYWLSVLLQLSVLLKDCQKALAFAFVCGLAQYGLRGDILPYGSHGLGPGP